MQNNHSYIYIYIYIYIYVTPPTKRCLLICRFLLFQLTFLVLHFAKKKKKPHANLNFFEITFTLSLFCFLKNTRMQSFIEPKSTMLVFNRIFKKCAIIKNHVVQSSRQLEKVFMVALFDKKN